MIWTLCASYSHLKFSINQTETLISDAQLILSFHAWAAKFHNHGTELCTRGNAIASVLLEEALDARAKF